VRTAEHERARSTILETFGELWCEAVVLVAVFGLLDKIVKHEDLTLAWTAASLGCAILLLVFGTSFKLLARIS
jgi:hypothetical protein